jgi:hypothetical protein
MLEIYQVFKLIENLLYKADSTTGNHNAGNDDITNILRTLICPPLLEITTLKRLIAKLPFSPHLQAAISLKGKC